MVELCQRDKVILKFFQRSKRHFNVVVILTCLVERRTGDSINLELESHAIGVVGRLSIGLQFGQA